MTSDSLTSKGNMKRSVQQEFHVELFGASWFKPENICLQI